MSKTTRQERAEDRAAADAADTAQFAAITAEDWQWGEDKQRLWPWQRRLIALAGAAVASGGVYIARRRRRG